MINLTQHWRSQWIITDNVHKKQLSPSIWNDKEVTQTSKQLLPATSFKQIPNKCTTIMFGFPATLCCAATPRIKTRHTIPQYASAKCWYSRKTIIRLTRREEVTPHTNTNRCRISKFARSHSRCCWRRARGWGTGSRLQTKEGRPLGRCPLLGWPNSVARSYRELCSRTATRLTERGESAVSWRTHLRETACIHSNPSRHCFSWQEAQCRTLRGHSHWAHSAHSALTYHSDPPPSTSVSIDTRHIHWLLPQSSVDSSRTSAGGNQSLRWQQRLSASAIFAFLFLITRVKPFERFPWVSKHNLRLIVVPQYFQSTEQFQIEIW